jgi:hypothetical protein
MVEVDLYCQQTTCEPDKCLYRDPGWYCFTDPSKGGYLCAGDQNQGQVAEGHQCPQSQVCRKQGTGPKDPAIL